MILIRNTYLRNGIHAHDRLDMVMSLKVGFLAFGLLLLSSSFLLVYSFISSCLSSPLDEIFRFCVCVLVQAESQSEKRKKKTWFGLCSLSFFLSLNLSFHFSFLSFSMLFGRASHRGGFCVSFFFSFCSLDSIFKITLIANLSPINSCLLVLPKPCV